MRSIVSSGGASAAHQGRKHGFTVAATDEEAVYSDDDVDCVVIATRHDLHAGQVVRALDAGKHVFVEKPLALTAEELRRVEQAYSTAAERGQRLIVGFNRRFAPQVVKLRELLTTAKSPRAIIITVNAGAIPADHWTQSRSVGGGRIIGEACHFVDLARHLADSPIIEASAMQLGQVRGLEVRDDKSTITMTFENGSMATIHYLANGHKSFPKERVEIFCDGAVLQLDNFRKLRGYGWPGFSSMNLWSQDKGNAACVKAFVAALKQGKAAPIPADEVFEVSRWTIDIADGLAH